MTPLEAAKDRDVWHALFGKGPVPPRREIRRFRRDVIHPGVAHYSAGVGASALIVGFCGRRSRLMMPVAVMLQFLDDRRYDMLTLADRRNLHFDAGIEGYAGSSPELAKRITTLAERRGYTSLIAYGTSMGGFAALRMGRMLGADRAISAGGRPVWHVSRMKERQPQVNAFDLICHCRAASKTRCYALFSSGVREDVDAAQRLAAIVPQSGLGGIPCSRHNFALEIFNRGRIAEYHREIFGLAREPDLDRLAAMVA